MSLRNEALTKENVKSATQQKGKKQLIHGKGNSEMLDGFDA